MYWGHTSPCGAFIKMDRHHATLSWHTCEIPVNIWNRHSIYAAQGSAWKKWDIVCVERWATERRKFKVLGPSILISRTVVHAAAYGKEQEKKRKEGSLSFCTEDTCVSAIYIIVKKQISWPLSNTDNIGMRRQYPIQKHIIFIDKIMLQWDKYFLKIILKFLYMKS